MSFLVKDIFLTVQGEGHNVGMPAVFVRFAGCNQWTGLDKDRARGNADCSRWCDTDFHGGQQMTHDEVIRAIAAKAGSAAMVVLTGGEPALQITDQLVWDILNLGLRCAVETNGTLPVPTIGPWITVSPKGGKHPLVVTSGNELKLVYPQALDPESFRGLRFEHFYLQPRDNTKASTDACMAYIHAYPRWKLSAQMHKYIGVA